MTSTACVTLSSVTSVTSGTEVAAPRGPQGFKRSYTVFNHQALENRGQFPLGGLPTEIIQLIFMQCVAEGGIKDFMALARTNIHSFSMMRKLVSEVALTQLCPNLRILDAKTYIFQADLTGIDKLDALQSYYKLEPFVEGRAGLTIVFNHGGLTLKNMKENNCGVTVTIAEGLIPQGLHTVSEEGGGPEMIFTSEEDGEPEMISTSEEDGGPEMISNAPVTGTRSGENNTDNEKRVCEVGFDGKPTLIGHLALRIATQKELGICLYRQAEQIFGHFSEYGGDSRLVVGLTPQEEYLTVHNRYRTHVNKGVGGSRKLQDIETDAL